jgi:hypothetical protein
LTHLT